MASTLGKRKRSRHGDRAPSVENNAPADELSVQEAFRKAFEAKFKPLKSTSDPTKKVEASAAIQSITTVEQDEDEDDYDWAGLSESDDRNDGEDDDDDDEADGNADSTLPGVEVVEHGHNYTRDRLKGRKEHKTFMSARPPTTDDPPSSKPSDKTSHGLDGDNSEAANLKNDLALQRLLTESHLLEPSGAVGSTQLVGRNRIKALDLRLQAIGGKKGSLTQQQKMAMSLRKGIDGKTRERDEKRRSEARENGIILERASGVKAAADGKSRDISAVKKKRGVEVGAPSIGRFKNGALMLSERDVRGMQSLGGGRSGGRGRGGIRRSRD